jgi:predicted permease
VNTIFITVLPVFGMIMLGYVFGKTNIIDVVAGKGLSLFVFNVAIPALLFQTMATLDSKDTAPWGLWLAYFGGLGVSWIIAAFVSHRIDALNHSGGAVASMATGFGNLALLGTPLALAHFGDRVAVPLGLILSIHAPVLWFCATLHRELFHKERGFSASRIGTELLINLSRNAIVIALVAGSLWRMTGLGLNPIPAKMLSMLSDASVPTALFALGVSLASYSLKGSWSGMFALIGLKMFLMPFLVFILSHYVIALPPLWAQIAVLFAAMPTGANAFLFAQRSEEATAAVSGAVAAGTGLAAITTSVLLYLMDAGVI